MAAGDFLVNEGTQVIFDDGTNGTVTFDPDVTNNNGHVSDPLTIIPGLFAWGAVLKVASGTPTVGNAIDIYLGLSDGVNDFNISQASADFGSANELKGAWWIGQVLFNSTSNADTFTAFGEIFIPVSQVQAIWWNGSGLTLSTTAGICKFLLTPIPYNEE